MSKKLEHEIQDRIGILFDKEYRRVRFNNAINKYIQEKYPDRRMNG